MNKFPQDFQLREGIWHPLVEDPIPYSDGDDAERYLYHVLKNTKDLTAGSLELASAIKDWPSEYHLSPLRANIFRPLEIKRNARVLELGCGCGAVTRYLGEIAGSVIAVEGSPVRANLARLRCENMGNVDIVSGNFDNIEYADTFDIVTLVGVLEYAPVYWRQAGDPFEGMIRRAWDHLSPNGVLVIAIENMMGMKYFSGCTEDHLSKHFIGIEGYPDPKGPRTFGRNELIDLAARCGFVDFELLLPFPDYKIPSILINGRFASARECLDYNLVDWCRETFRDYGSARKYLFSDELALSSMARNGMMADFANSFLLIAGKGNMEKDSAVPRPEWIAKKFNILRRSEFQTVTTLKHGIGGPVVVKERVKELPLPISSPVRLDLESQCAYIRGGTSLYRKLLLSTRRLAGSAKEFPEHVTLWVNFLRGHLNPGTPHLPPDFIDCIPRNLILDSSDRLHYIDNEWRWHEPVPMDWVLYRGLWFFWIACKQWIEGSLLPPGHEFSDFLRFSLGPSGIAIDEGSFDELVARESVFQQEVHPRLPTDRRMQGRVSPMDQRETELTEKVERLFSSGETGQALELAFEIAKKYPANFLNWNNLGVIFSSMGMKNDAKDCLRVAVSLNKDFSDAWRNLDTLEGIDAMIPREGNGVESDRR